MKNLNTVSYRISLIMIAVSFLLLEKNPILSYFLWLIAMLDTLFYIGEDIFAFLKKNSQ